MEIKAEYCSGRLIVHMRGELDHHGARRAAEDIGFQIDRFMPRDTVLDMSGLSFMDSSGIALLLRVERRMRAAGGRVWVENPAKQPLRVLDASGIDRLINVRGEQRA